MEKIMYWWNLIHKDSISWLLSDIDKLLIKTLLNTKKEDYFFSIQERLYIVHKAFKYSIYNNIHNIENKKYQQEDSMLDNQESNQKTEINRIKNTSEIIQSIQKIYMTTIKNIFKEEYIIESFPVLMKQAIEEKFFAKHIFGITGVPGSWKSFMTNILLQLCQKNKIPYYHLDLDKIAHEIQDTLEDHIYRETRQKIIAEFGSEVDNGDGSINRKKLSPKAFGNQINIEKLNAIMHESICMRVRTIMDDHQWLFFYDAALIAEMDMLSIMNNNSILITVDPEVQHKRLIKRLEKKWIHEEEISTLIDNQLARQYTTQQKRAVLNDQINKDGYGKIIEIKSPYKEKDLEKVFNTMLGQVDIFGELRFIGLCNRLWIDENIKKKFTELRKIYNTSLKRLHVRDCINELYQVKHLLDNPDAVELALLFHYSVYIPGQENNEEQSSLLAEKTLTQRGVWQDMITIVKKHITSTSIWQTKKDKDEKYMMDIDISILGKDKKDFIQYMYDRQKEFEIYNVYRYKEIYSDMFKEMLAQDNIYKTKYFQTKYNNQAKENLQEYIV